MRGKMKKNLLIIGLVFLLISFIHSLSLAQGPENQPLEQEATQEAVAKPEGETAEENQSEAGKTV